MKTYQITDGNGAVAVILPEKGATVTSYSVDGQEYLFTDWDNLHSASRPRCGIPFLFPTFGRTPKDSPYPLEIHGFGHTSSWKVLSADTNSLQVLLESNADILPLYPFHFRVILTFTLRDKKLIIHQRYENTGEETMPYAFGFHPYFLTGNPEAAEITVNAAMEMNMVTGQSAPCGRKTLSVSFAEGAEETGAFFMNASDSVLIRADGRKLRMYFDNSFTRVVLWAVKGRPFLCAEPINSSPNGLATGDCFYLAPGEVREAEISFEPTK